MPHAVRSVTLGTLPFTQDIWRTRATGIFGMGLAEAEEVAIWRGGVGRVHCDLERRDPPPVFGCSSVMGTKVGEDRD